MEWLNVTAEQGLAGLVLASFLASTVLPVSSEALLWAFLSQHPEQVSSALLLATLGNTAGGMVSWACGRYMPRWQRLETLPYKAPLERWGSAALLLSWVPLIGDGLCLAAGWLRLPWLSCTLWMLLGKSARYAVLLWLLDWVMNL